MTRVIADLVARGAAVMSEGNWKRVDRFPLCLESIEATGPMLWLTFDRFPSTPAVVDVSIHER
jgi:hypothetical protein